jgi:hypothetical protein
MKRRPRPLRKSFEFGSSYSPVILAKSACGGSILRGGTSLRLHDVQIAGGAVYAGQDAAILRRNLGRKRDRFVDCLGPMIFGRWQSSYGSNTIGNLRPVKATSPELGDRMSR